MNEIIKFLKKRRSVTAKKMLPGKVTESDLERYFRMCFTCS